MYCFCSCYTILSARLFNKIQKRKPAHDRISFLSRTSVKIHPRCHLDSRNDPCTLRNTCIFPATDVCPTSQNTEPIRNNDCSLRPQRSIWQSASPPGSHHPELSVGASTALISASTVCIILDFLTKIPHFFGDVNKKNVKLV